MASYREVVDILAALLRALDNGKTLPPSSVLLTTGKALVIEARQGRNGPTPWTPLEKVNPLGVSTKTLAEVARRAEISMAEVTKHLAAAHEGTVTYANNRYQVMVKEVEPDDGSPPMRWLSIRRIDQETVRDWRDLQRIKDEICGPEWEAVELFPARSRLVDTANQYHLWCIPEAFPFGFMTGIQIDDAGVGENQRPLAGDVAP